MIVRVTTWIPVMSTFSSHCCMPIVRNSVLLFNLRLSFNIHKQMSNVQFSMSFKGERLSDLWLGLNEIQQFQCTHSLVDICIYS